MEEQSFVKIETALKQNSAELREAELKLKELKTEATSFAVRLTRNCWDASQGAKKDLEEEFQNLQNEFSKMLIKQELLMDSFETILANSKQVARNQRAVASSLPNSIPMGSSRGSGRKSLELRPNCKIRDLLPQLVENLKKSEAEILPLLLRLEDDWHTDTADILSIRKDYWTTHPFPDKFVTCIQQLSAIAEKQVVFPVDEDKKITEQIEDKKKTKRYSNPALEQKKDRRFQKSISVNLPILSQKKKIPVVPHLELSKVELDRSQYQIDVLVKILLGKDVTDDQIFHVRDLVGPFHTLKTKKGKALLVRRDTT